MKVKVGPSILSADFSRLGDELKAVAKAGADFIHIDVMDGHFVPNITIGPGVVKDLKKNCPLVFDVHLMIENPGKFVEEFIRAGSNMLTFHAETVSEEEFGKLSAQVRGWGIKCGISVNPPTPIEKIKPYLKDADLVLLMSVNPGFGGQSFIPGVLPKITALREIFKGDISVDGGINQQTAEQSVKAGANMLVAGTHIFKSFDYAKVISRLKSIN